MMQQKFEIWQLPTNSPFKFQHYDWIIGTKPSIRDYVPTYSGESLRVDGMETELFLEKLFYIFNNEEPADYHGFSMSVSDAICLIDENNKRTWWYVDGQGFAKLDW